LKAIERIEKIPKHSVDNQCIFMQQHMTAIWQYVIMGVRNALCELPQGNQWHNRIILPIDQTDWTVNFFKVDAQIEFPTNPQIR